jgi:hypothetical protein
MGQSHLSGAIDAAIINHQPLHHIAAGHCAGQGLERNAQGFFFVEAGNLNNQLSHGSVARKTLGAIARI